MRIDRMPPKRGFARRVVAHEEPPAPLTGIVLLDSSAHVFAFDLGAATIFDWKDSTPSEKNSVRLPDEVMASVAAGRTADSPGPNLHVIANRRYRSRSYDVLCEDTADSHHRITALHLESEDQGDADSDPIGPIVEEYGLTEREHQALRGIALGLTTKELAEEMRISPHTVRAFVRLIMIKLGVTTRGAIVSKLLEHNEPRRHMAMAGGGSGFGGVAFGKGS